MNKFLLIVILFLPANGNYKDFVFFFPIMDACEKAKEVVEGKIEPQKGVSISVACAKSEPTERIGV